MSDCCIFCFFHIVAFIGRVIVYVYLSLGRFNQNVSFFNDQIRLHIQDVGFGEVGALVQDSHGNGIVQSKWHTRGVRECESCFRFCTLANVQTNATVKKA